MKILLSSLIVLLCHFTTYKACSQQWVYRPTTYTYLFDTNATAQQARTYLGIPESVTNSMPASTNIALLSGNNTFTGTNTFSGSVNVPKFRLLLATNIFISTLGMSSGNYNANATPTATNITINTPFQYTLFTSSIPALLATNSRVCYEVEFSRTNAQQSGNNPAYEFTVGTNVIALTATSFAGSPTFTNFSLVSQQGAPPAELFRNAGSMTVQSPTIRSIGATWMSTATRSLEPLASYIDSSSPWDFAVKIGWGSGYTTVSNLSITMRLVEIIQPGF